MIWRARNWEVDAEAVVAYVRFEEELLLGWCVLLWPLLQAVAKVRASNPCVIH
jgi:hypothetical protein